MLLGAHVPVTGGLGNAPGRGRAVGADAIQIFTRNQMQWEARPLAEEETAAFREALLASGVRVVMAHGSYLVNLAGINPEFLEKSRQAFLSEILRCHRLGIPYLVFHPGAHMGAGEAEGVRAIVRSLDEILEHSPGDVMPLLEVTAGQGTCLGHRFEQLAEIIGRVSRPDRLGVCLDTCHLLAAGYDIVDPRGYERTLRELETVVGLEKVKAVHLNDAKGGLGSRLDRHAPIGRGGLGLETLRRLVNEPRFQGLPLVVETPGPLSAWRSEIAFLRRLRGAVALPPRLRLPRRPRPPARPRGRSRSHGTTRARAAR